MKRQSKQHEKDIYTVYSSGSDMTFIMQDTLQKDTQDIISIEVIGFYFGEPDEELTKQYIGNLKAVYTDGGHEI